MPNFPIDIVVPWVDGDDTAWKAERSKFRPQKNSDSNEARFREWGLFQYWFRSIEKYAPWVRTVHLITWGHLPPWLNTEHPKLNIVNHRSYIPADKLPVFNSVPIENFVHKIPDLAEHFIMFNDDVYLSRPTTPEDFFKNGLPVDTAILSNVTISDRVSFMPYLALNCLGIINEAFSKREVLRANWKKWFSLKYGKLALFNLYYYPGKNFAGFRSFHTGVPFTKSTFNEVWEKYPTDLENGSKSRFRSREDVNDYIFRYWRLAKGEFTPGKPNCAYLTIGEDDAIAVERAMKNKKYKIVCVNDDPTGLSFAEEQKRLKELFEKIFPNPSAFEKL